MNTKTGHTAYPLCSWSCRVSKFFFKDWLLLEGPLHWTAPEKIYVLPSNYPIKHPKSTQLFPLIWVSGAGWIHGARKVVWSRELVWTMVQAVWVLQYLQVYTHKFRREHIYRVHRDSKNVREVWATEKIQMCTLTRSTENIQKIPQEVISILWLVLHSQLVATVVFCWTFIGFENRL